MATNLLLYIEYGTLLMSGLKFTAACRSGMPIQLNLEGWFT
eukprot:SAG31_NODE_32417_length_356_cov_0.797665_1_plen_40_part_01